MSRQTDRLARLVDDLLDTARIQSGRFDLNCKPVDLMPVVQEVLERFEVRGSEGLRFHLEPPPWLRWRAPGTPRAWTRSSPTC